MLYIFHVDTGTMMTFDMNLAMEKVINLQGVIARGCRISEDKQVLLISGGESLDPNAVVGKYHAGTDTNPIFLFSKSTIESAIPPSPSVNYGSDIDLQGQVEGSLLMPPAYETVVSRAQLAL
ncbi:RB1-inducible coiled-coil protein 1-like, partial [Ruditapes philippinarum]